MGFSWQKFRRSFQNYKLKTNVSKKNINSSSIRNPVALPTAIYAFAILPIVEYLTGLIRRRHYYGHAPLFHCLYVLNV